MNPFTSNGTIRQEDIQACNIARSAIARSLAQEARQTALLVTFHHREDHDERSRCIAC